MKQDIISYMFNVEDTRTKSMFITHFGRQQLNREINYIQWGKKVFSQPRIVQVLPLKKMREACNFHHRYTSTMRDKIRKLNLENHIVGFLNNLFANYGGK